MDQSSGTGTVSQQLSRIMENADFRRFGVTALDHPVSLDFYRQWLKNDNHGEMIYLMDHLPLKEDPTRLLTRAKTAITVAVDYVPHPKPDSTVSSLRIARYARGEDYHLWLKEKLELLVDALKSAFPDESFVAATDSKPVLERDMAYRSGLGWFGKNTCLIDQRHGSYFLLGEILTTLELKTAAAVHPDRCGKCTRCIDACPTGAIIEPRLLDARRCISYLTIESKTVPGVELRSKIGDWFFGCDVCQQVCPWNEKVFGERAKDPRPERESLIEELRVILKSTGGELQRRLKSSPLSRARPFGLKRNAIIVAANLKLHELKDEIAVYIKDDKLAELAGWALGELERETRP